MRWFIISPPNDCPVPLLVVVVVATPGVIAGGGLRGLGWVGGAVGTRRHHGDGGGHRGMDLAKVGEAPGLGKGAAEGLTVLEVTAIPDTVWAWRISGGGGVRGAILLRPDNGVAYLYSQVLVPEVPNI